MSEVAYGERKQSDIKKRSRLNKIYMLLKRITRVFYNPSKIETILAYPSINTMEELANVVNKMSWTFPLSDKLNIYIAVNEKLDTNNICFESIDSNQKLFYDKTTTNIQFIKVTEIETKLDSDMILLFDISKFFDKKILLRFAKLEIMDENYFSTVEAQVLQTYFYKTLSEDEKESYTKISKNNFAKLNKIYKNSEKAYCFVTGPSFDKYKDFEYEKDSFKVICNSTVKNNDFLEYIGKPDLLVFADPVFHFSPCLYSSYFRDEVIKVFKKYDCFIAIPLTAMPLILKYYPELKERLIGIEHRTSKIEKILKKPVDNFNFPSLENVFVKSSANILTLYMIPFASAMAKNIFIIGADGREKSEKYFWKHSSSAQFDELMQTVFDTHPSFFRDRDYEDYYDEHCAFLERQIQFGEKKGKKYYSLTDSFIPALSVRKAD